EAMSSLCRSSVPLVTKAVLQHQTRRDLIAVLNKPADCADEDAVAYRIHAIRTVCVCKAIDEVCCVAEVDDSGGIRKVAANKAAELSTGLNRVSAPDDGQGIGQNACRHKAPLREARRSAEV